MLTRCVCGSSNSGLRRIVGHEVLVECTPCGVVRLNDVDPATYRRQYEDGSYLAATTPARKARKEIPAWARFGHDRHVAKSRLTKLARWKTGGRLLDVGCGNGAFVAEAVAMQFDALGTDLCLEAAAGQFLGSRLFTGGITGAEPQWRKSFSAITYHDVLEHCLDPVRELQFARALLADDGILVLELPDMGEPEFEKHIKPDEHIWYWTAAQMLAFLDSQHWRVHQLEHPIPGKMAVYATPAEPTTEVVIYVPPGIGDIAWCLTKVEAIRKLHEPCTVTMKVSGLSNPRTVDRAQGYLDLVPFVDRVEFEQFPFASDSGQLLPEYPIYQLYPNPHLEAGRRIEDWQPQWATNLQVPLFQPAFARAWADRFAKKESRPLVLLYASSQEYYKEFLPFGGWTPFDWVRVVCTLNDCGFHPVLVGSEWDLDYAAEILAGVPKGVAVESLVGKTTVAELLALARVSAGVIGLACGVTILSTYAGVPTLALWPVGEVSRNSAIFTPGFQFAWVPDRCHANYAALPLADAVPGEVVGLWRNLLNDERLRLREVA